MEQQEIWKRHLLGYSLDDLLRSYQAPACFQKELADFICGKSDTGDLTIEVGCELGVTSMLLNKSKQTTLLDLNNEAIKLSRKAHEVLNMEAEFVVADMFRIPFMSSKFDVLFNAGVIEHFDKEERILALKEYGRVLKQDGKMFIAFPNHYCPPYRVAYLLKSFLGRWEYPSEYKLFDMAEEIQQAGLVIEARDTLSKSTVFKWLNFIKPLKVVMELYDHYFPFEGYLTVLTIVKSKS